MATVAFIGTGNMGGALARAAAKSGRASRLLLANRSREKLQRLAGELQAEVVDNRRAAAEADYLFLAVKPQQLDGMLAGITDVLAARESRCVILSMIAGRDLASLEERFGADTPVIRLMPNIPVAVGGGITLFSPSAAVTEEEKTFFQELLRCSGLVTELEEPLLDAATGVAGCGTAYAAMFAEALADGAVACGLPRAQALRFAAQMLAGTAQLLLDSGEHPGALKDRVCSPGGSTIQGVRALEEAGFRAAVMNAVIAAYEKEF